MRLAALTSICTLAAGLGWSATAAAGGRERTTSQYEKIAKRAVSRWAKRYDLPSYEVREQLESTTDGLKKIEKAGGDVPDAWKFKYKVLAPPTGSKRSALVMRSNQPAPENLVELGAAAAKQGIKPEEVAIINLRIENGMEREFMNAAAKHDDPEVRRISGFQQHHIRIIDHSIPTDSQVLQVLKVAADAKTKLVVIHCAAGVARTGLMVAAIRIALDGWDVDRALSEARSNGLSRKLQELFVRDFAKRWKAGTLKLPAEVSL